MPTWSVSCAASTASLPIALRRWRRAAAPRGSSAPSVAPSTTALRRERYDVVLDTQGLVKSALVARRARLASRRRTRRLLARAGRASRLARLFYDRGLRRRPATARDRADARAGGARLRLRDRTSGRRASSSTCRRASFDWLARRRVAAYVVLLHATARPEKAWPPERWVGLIARCADAGHRRRSCRPATPRERAAARSDWSRGAIAATTPCDGRGRSSRPRCRWSTRPRCWPARARSSASTPACCISRRRSTCRPSGCSA